MAYDTEFTPQTVLNRAYSDDSKSISTNSSFKTNYIDNYTTTNVVYICQENSEGTWLTMKIDQTGNFPVLTYATIKNNPTMTNFTDAYTNRTTLNYNLYSVVV
jgi:hypothetical protein